MASSKHYGVQPPSLDHPAYSRYPFLKKENPFVKKEKEKVYTDWKKTFAWRPVKLIDNKWIWLETVFKRYACFYLSVDDNITLIKTNSAEYVTTQMLLEMKFNKE